jgi:hypothetical protein
MTGGELALICRDHPDCEVLVASPYDPTGMITSVCYNADTDTIVIETE